MSLTLSLRNSIEKAVAEHSGKEQKIKNTTPVSGGDIHDAYKISTEEATYFLKTSPQPPQNLFKTEFQGLQLLKEQQVISIPEPIAYSQSEKEGYLLMEFVERTPTNPDFWQVFAKAMADLHLCSSTTFGLKEDNYIGPLPQSNTPHDNWSDFFISQRLQPLIKKCIDRKLLTTDFIDKSMQLYSKIPDYFPKEKPALLHGDLWGGNYLCGTSAQPYLFDPAVYYGHREIDLAMTRLFGGFDRQFYWHYNEYYPLEPDWQKRIRLCQLYPLLVHSLLFGGGYVQQVRSIIEEYG